MNAAGAVLATDQWLYNANSDVVSHTRPNGAADTFVYDELDRLSGSNTLLVAPAVYSTATSGFDVAGNMVRLTDPMNNVTRMQYNNWGLLKSTIEPATTAFPNVADGTWGVGYDAGGMPVSESRPGGVSVARVYDGLGRLTSETGAGTGAVAATRQYAYDSVGRVTSAGTGVAAQSFTYDDRGLVLSANGGSGASSFTYDVLGRMASRTDGSGTASFGYTDRNELSSYTAGGASVSQSWNAFGVGHGELSVGGYS